MRSPRAAPGTIQNSCSTPSARERRIWPARIGARIFELADAIGLHPSVAQTAVRVCGYSFDGGIVLDSSSLDLDLTFVLPTEV